MSSPDQTPFCDASPQPEIDYFGGADTGESSAHRRMPDGITSHQRDSDVPSHLEDAYIGARIARERLAGKFVFASALGWMGFDGRRWEQVDELLVAEVVRQALTDLHRAEAHRGADTNRLRQISSMLSASRIRAILYVAKMKVTTTAEEFDTHPDLLNVRNGVVDLHTGEMRPHDPNLMLTKVSLVDYQPGAHHPDWDQALGALPAGTSEWLQVRLGQGITGHPVPDDRLVVLKGSGANGKTTLLDAIREAVGGDYVVTLPDRVLLARTGDHPTELMSLRGARLALMEEFPELGHLNVKRLKDLHGTGEMTARYCGRDTVAWKPTHTVFVTTNYLPRVDESDHGTWRRLVLVDFPFRFCNTNERHQTPSDRPGDPDLRNRLRHGQRQREAVLAWIIQGALRWYQNGRGLPDDPHSVVDSTAAWRKSSDLLLRYFADNLVFDRCSHVVSTELYADFLTWLEINGHRPWSDQSFTSRLQQHPEAVSHGVVKERVRTSQPGLHRRSGSHSEVIGNSGKYMAWIGVRFRTEDDNQEAGDTPE